MAHACSAETFVDCSNNMYYYNWEIFRQEAFPHRIFDWETVHMYNTEFENLIAHTVHLIQINI